MLQELQQAVQMMPHMTACTKPCSQNISDMGWQQAAVQDGLHCTLLMDPPRHELVACCCAGGRSWMA